MKTKLIVWINDNVQPDWLVCSGFSYDAAAKVGFLIYEIDEHRDFEELCKLADLKGRNSLKVDCKLLEKQDECSLVGTFKEIFSKQITFTGNSFNYNLREDCATEVKVNFRWT